MSTFKTISQETFDAVVEENMNEFEMSIEEAIEDAVQQFKTQNVDLFNIVKQVYGDGENERILPSQKFKSLVKDLESESEEFNALESIIKECDKGLAHRCLIGKYGVVEQLIKKLGISCERWEERVKLVLKAFVFLTNGQPDILKQDSLELLLKLLNDLIKENTCDKILMDSIMRIFYNCCIKHEENRQTLVNAGVIECAMLIMLRNKNNQELITASCSLLRVLTLDDDIRVPFGKAHDHAKLIATNHSGINVLLEIAEAEKQNANILSEVIATLCCLTVRNEFCQEINDKGGLQLIFDCVINNLENMGLVRSSLGLLKTLAGNDAVKTAIVNAGGVRFILLAMNKYQGESKICEAGCACFAALALRSPSNCQAIIDSGAANAIITAMKVHKNEPFVQKHACRAVRDLVARCRQYCPIFLDNGVEDLIREAVTLHSQHVYDDAKAALRDLGCKVELKELWTGQKGSIAQD